MNKTTSIFIILAICIIAVVLYYKNTMNKSFTETAQPSVTTLPTTEPGSSNNTNISAKEFIIEGGNFSFTPNVMKVNKGDTVKITFKNMEGMHDLVIDEFNVRTNKIKTGEQETIQFVADKTGSFEFYCSVGTHRQMGMKGTLEVM